jgi:hypothetical protein
MKKWPLLALTAAALLLGGPVSAANDGKVESGLERTAIGMLAGKLEPGQFAVLKSTLPAGYERFYDFLRVQVEDGRRLEIDGWSDAADWDPKRGKLFFLGKRKHKKFISYDARTNAWEELGWAGDPPPQYEKFGRPYGRSALDWEHGHYYHLSLVDGRAKGLYRYLIDERRWERMPDLPSGGSTSVASMSMAWHRGLGKLVLLDRTGRGHQLWAFDGKAWSKLGLSNAEGHHSQMQYNEKRGDLLIAGGSKSKRKMDLLTADGALKPLPDAPFDMTIRNSDLTYDPQSGNYLYMRQEKKELWELDPKTWLWEKVATWTDESWPFGQFGYLVPAQIDQLGVVFWLHQRSPQLYRHRPRQP